MHKALRLCVVLLLLSVGILAESITVQVEIINVAPVNGASLTPVWVGFHNGDFDAFDPDTSASEALERLAEDGDTTFISQQFRDDDDDDRVDGTIIADNTSVPSNDAFVGSRGSRQYDLFDGDIFEDLIVVIEGDDVWDAGTEVNDEIPENTAFFGQTEPNTGVTENALIERHPGLLPPGSGGIVDQPQFVNADFSEDDDYIIAQLSVRFLYVNQPLYSENTGTESIATVASASTLSPGNIVMAGFCLWLFSYFM